jgi:hypothetical protein
MDVGSVLPALMPDPAMVAHMQPAPAAFESDDTTTGLSQPLAMLDHAMTIGRDQEMNDLLAQWAKGDMTPGQTLVAEFKLKMLETQILEVNNVANSIKSACEKLQQ